MENRRVFETTIRVRYQETDQMGVVYHTNYIVWFEVARSEMIRELGTSYRELEEKGLLLPVVDVHCRYLSPAHYDEEVIVRTVVKELTGSKIRFGYEVVRRDDNRLLTVGSTTHIWVNREMKRVNIQRDDPELYRLLVEQTLEGESISCYDGSSWR
ncbi:acyl-CoA thioesterase [Polycladomyces sp. WAk]|uniref:Acyl-CoA thioesterase n=1 Tax=Polycladomyces zharkentensis TaxID=2807616 RepID=A0ABS2WHK3_9BACL|nr:thioesterase family protein [Polycladomyces sp. WAk]MBN2908996.1 acyl-CoA thioesterase [Polycladomyces sp. WAk]